MKRHLKNRKIKQAKVNRSHKRFLDWGWTKYQTKNESKLWTYQFKNLPLIDEKIQKLTFNTPSWFEDLIPPPNHDQYKSDSHQVYFSFGLLPKIVE